MNAEPNSRWLLLASVLPLVMISVFVLPGCGREKGDRPQSSTTNESPPTIRLIYKLDAARKVMEEGELVPKFQYDPRSHVQDALAKAGFRASEAGHGDYDMTLMIEYTERMHSDRYFADSLVVSLFRVTLTDAQDAVLLRVNDFLIDRPSEVIDYVEKRLGAEISDRLRYEDEMLYLLSRFDTQMSSSVPKTRASVESSLSLLARMFELKDARAGKAFLRALRSPDPRQRWIAKFGLLELGIEPDVDSDDFVWFEMVNVPDFPKDIVAYNFLRSRELLEEHKDAIQRRDMRTMIVRHGEPAIAIIIDNLRCQKITPYLGWYGGGDISETDPVLVLKGLRQDRWQKYTRRFVDPSGRKWQPKWREAAVSILCRELAAEHPDLEKETRLSYRRTLLDILSELGDASTIPLLRDFQSSHPDLAELCEAAIDTLGQRAD